MSTHPKKTLRSHLMLTLGLSLLGLVSSPAVTFENIISAGDPIPGGAGTVDLLTYPVISGGITAFSAIGIDPNSGRQIYGGTGSSLSPLVSYSTAIPSGSGTFTNISDPAFNAGRLAFAGDGSGGQSGIYSGAPTSYVRIADRNTIAPGTAGETFDSFDPARIAINGAGDVAFVGNTTSGTGLYRSSAGLLTAVATTADLVPGTAAQFAVLEGPALTSTHTFFFGSAGTASTVGVFGRAFSGGPVEAIAYAGGSSPTGDTWITFASPVAGGDTMVFLGDTDNDRGIYRYQNDTLEAIIRTGEYIPGTTTLLNDIDLLFAVNEDGDIVMTLLDADSNRYIYAYVDDQFLLVADTDTVIDGKTPLVGVPSLGISTSSFSGNQVALYAVTGSGEFGVYVATIPEPSTYALLAIAAGLVLLRVRSTQRIG